MRRRALAAVQAMRWLCISCGCARALAILEQYDDRAFSLTDAASFAVMGRLGIVTAFSLDRHFTQYDWQIVPLDGSSSNR